jgi:hypothetical protein
VHSNSLVQHYSSKTDDELLVLAAQQAALTEDAKSALAGELRRRNLDENAKAIRYVPAIATSGPVARALVSAKWLGLWLLNTIIATFGVAMTIGFLTYSSQSFVSRAARMRFMVRFIYTPYSPILIITALVIGYLSYRTFRGSYRYWVWVLPTADVGRSLLNWKESNQASWSNSLSHFFGFLPYAENRDQLDSTLFLYLSLAYTLGVLVHASVHDRLTTIRRTA